MAEACEDFFAFIAVEMLAQFRIGHRVIKGVVTRQRAEVTQSRMSAIQDADFGFFIGFNGLNDFDANL